MASSTNRTLLFYDKICEHHEKPSYESTVWYDNASSTSDLESNAVENIHPENSCRTRWLLKRLHDRDQAHLLSRVEIKTGRDATEEELNLAHSLDYIHNLKSTSQMHRKEALDNFAAQYDDIDTLSSATWPAAVRAAGAAICLVEEVCRNPSTTSGMSAMRPPGHHAGPYYAFGYCYINNVAVCTKYALERLRLKRVMILDWDVHFGNGTQHIFYHEPRVLHVSIHRFHDCRSWPWLKEADVGYIGAGAGVGKNVNFPLNESGCDFADYEAIFKQIILPLASEFKPQLIVVASGFDAVQGDPMGEMRLTPNCFASLTWQLKQVANCGLALVLEGGYNVPEVAESALACLRVLASDDAPPPPSPQANNDAGPRDAVQSVINRMKLTLRPYWKCFEGAEKGGGEINSFDYDFKYDYKTPDCPSEERFLCGNDQWSLAHKQVIKQFDDELRQNSF